jgi:hypothetical protein
MIKDVFFEKDNLLASAVEKLDPVKFLLTCDDLDKLIFVTTKITLNPYTFVDSITVNLLFLGLNWDPHWSQKRNKLLRNFLLAGLRNRQCRDSIYPLHKWVWEQSDNNEKRLLECFSCTYTGLYSLVALVIYQLVIYLFEKYQLVINQIVIYLTDWSAAPRQLQELSHQVLRQRLQRGQPQSRGLHKSTSAQRKIFCRTEPNREWVGANAYFWEQLWRIYPLSYRVWQQFQRRRLRFRNVHFGRNLNLRTIIFHWQELRKKFHPKKWRAIYFIWQLLTYFPRHLYVNHKK